VAGNFHVAFGDSVVKDGRHIHQFVPSEAPGFDVSHTIHHISFGEEYPGRVNPLDGKVSCGGGDDGGGVMSIYESLELQIHCSGLKRRHLEDDSLSNVKSVPLIVFCLLCLFS